MTSEQPKKIDVDEEGSVVNESGFKLMLRRPNLRLQ